MTLSPGTHLGPYEITAPLGVGGMGEVYRATDTNLKRQVAIKVLPASVAGDPERLARFQREAEVLAALNHPNIAHIHGLEKADGTIALVMEFVEGPTLADRIATGAIPVEEALQIARHIAAGLEAAHEQGIVHRDLKPANVKVRPDGIAKILDFGLAKALEPTGATSPSVSMSPTITSPAMTQAGIILGTAAYMAPEQARGKPVDKRADIWAFGCVLFEALSGRCPFGGDDISMTLAAILTAEPDWLALPGSTPPLIRRLLVRCLKKDPKDRLQAIGDARVEIEEAISGVEPLAIARVGRPKSRSVVPWIVAAAGLAVAAGVIGWQLTAGSLPAVPSKPVAFSVAAEPGTNASVLGNAPGLIPEMSLSPDGRQLLLRTIESDGSNRFWLRSMNELHARPLPATDTSVAAAAAYIFWSPDSRRFASNQGGRLWVRGVDGGPSQALCDTVNFRGGAWANDGTIVFAQLNQGLSTVRVSAPGECHRLTAFPSTAVFPSWLNGGVHVLFTISSAADGHEPGIYVATREGKDLHQVLRDASRAIVVQDRIIFVRDHQLVSQHFDARGLLVSGELNPIATGIYLTRDKWAPFDASIDGVLAYAPGLADNMRLRWFDRTGREVDEIAGPGQLMNAALSPDGAMVVADQYGDDGNRDLWLYRDGTAPTRLTFDPLDDSDGVWSHDSSQIYFGSTREGGAVFEKPVSGTAVERLVARTGMSTFPRSISRDNGTLVYQTLSAGNWDIWAVSLTDAAPKPVPVFVTAKDEMHPSFAPHRDLIAYTSNESGTYEVYVSPFPPTGVKWQVSTGGGRYPTWRSDGRELFFVRADGNLVAVDVRADASGVAFGPPQKLFQTGIFALASGRPRYSPSRDGQKFLVTVTPDVTIPINVIVNWTALESQSR